MDAKASYYGVVENATPGEYENLVLAHTLAQKFPQVGDDNNDIFETVLNCLPQPVIVISIKRNAVLFTNTIGEKRLGKSVKEILKIDLRVLQIWAAHGDALEEMLSRDNQVTGFPYKYLERDRSEAWGSVSLAALDYFGDAVHIMSFHDVTAQHVSYAALLQKEDRLTSQNQALAYLGRHLPSYSEDLNSALDLVLETVATTLGANCVSLWNEERQISRNFSILHGQGNKKCDAVFLSQNAEKLEKVIHWLCQDGVVNLTEENSEKRYPKSERKLLAANNLEKSLIVAIRLEDIVIGHMCICRKESGDVFHIEDTTFAVSVTAIIETLFEARRIADMQQVLLQREEQTRSLIDRAPSSLLVFGEDGNIRFVSTVFCESMGYSLDEAIGAPIISFVHPEDHGNVAQVLMEVMQGKVISAFRFRAQHADGRWLLLEAAGSDLRDDVVVKGFLVGLRDITESEKMADQLERNKAELRTIVDASLSSVCLIDEEGVLLRANKTFGEKWDVLLPELIGHNASEFIPDEQVALTHKAIEEVVRTGEICQIVFEQKERWFETIVNPVLKDNKGAGTFVISTTDITDKRNYENAMQASEERLRDIAEYATDWFWETDENLNYSYLSKTEGALFEGVFSVKLGGYLFDFLGGVVEMDDQLEVDEIVKAKQPFRNVQFSFLENGKTYFVTVAGKPYFSEEGDFLGYRGTGQDITTEVEARQQAQEVEKKLFQSQKMEAVGQLTGGVAHDFNNLLAIICGNIELLKEQVQDNESLSNLAINALTAVERGSSLTQRLLAFSKKQVLIPKQVSLPGLVDGMKQIFGRALAENITVVTSYEGDIWPVVLDSAQMENALLNLAINARDAMPNGGQLTIQLQNKVIVEAAVTDQDVPPGEYVSLSVSDTGTGIDASVLPYIFDPFYSTKAIGKGTGLGLSMVFGFVGQSEGYISVTSVMEEGTCFEIMLPRNETDIYSDGPMEGAAQKREMGALSVLLVEDDEDVRAITYQQLINSDCEVVQAADAKEAVKIIKNSPEIQLLLTDIMLPGGKNGNELAMEARSLSPNLKVLCMSGYLGEDNVLATSSDKDIHFIGKPYRHSELMEKIQKIVMNN